LSFRSTAMGVIYAIGRVGTIIGPFIVGVMLAANMNISVLMVAMASPSVVALVAFLFVTEASPQGAPLLAAVATE